MDGVYGTGQDLVHPSGPVVFTALDSPPGQEVLLYSGDHAFPVACAFIAPERPKKYQGVNITKTRTLVTITKVLVPGYVIPGELLETHRDTSFSAFPAPPFSLVWKLKNMRSGSPPQSSLSHPTSSTTEGLSPTSLSRLAKTPCAITTSVEGRLGEPATEIDPCDSAVLESNVTPNWYKTPATGTTLDDDEEPEPEQTVESSVTNVEAQQKAQAMLTMSQHEALAAQENPIRSRMLGDIFHLFNQFPISIRHGLARPFACALQVAFFILDAEDKENVEAVLAAKGLTLESMIKTNPKWVLKRIRRVVPPPETLLQQCASVMHLYGPLEDSKTHLPLFNETAWDIAKNVLENIRRGFYSDLPNISLYFPRIKDKDGLMRYRCSRGTNTIKGGVHQNIIRWFGAFNASPEFVVELLQDYRLYHNLKVGTLNRTGKPYMGSWDIWKRNKISQLTNILDMCFTSPPQGFDAGTWVNGDEYVSSNEKFGILPLPERIQTDLGILPYNPQRSEDKAPSNGTVTPITPFNCLTSTTLVPSRTQTIYLLIALGVAVLVMALHAEINVLQLIDEAGAAAAVAATELWGESDGVNVLQPDCTQLLVDIGASGTSIHIFSVREGLTYVLASAHTESISATQIDDKLINFFSADFVKKT
ncbi:hypothetical protein CPC08DRAFT_770877 [Agrocybe pediades]|nr:hypothetical protein CPC08DRAFT_770877 [Agrocybe pediades]